MRIVTSPAEEASKMTEEVNVVNLKEEADLLYMAQLCLDALFKYVLNSKVCLFFLLLECS